MNRTTRTLLHLLLAALAAAAVPREAAADTKWLVTGDAPAVVPLADPQQSRFGAGAMPAIAVYRTVAPWSLVGLRARAGILADAPAMDDAPDSGLADPRAGGLASLGLSLRLRPPGSSGRRGTGPWMELVGGVGVTGDLVRPVVEAGIGWGVKVGSANIGPSLRYLHIVQTDGPLDDRSAHLGLIGVEISLFDRGAERRPKRLPVAAEPAARPTPPPVERAPEPAPEPSDRDGDRIVDADDACPDEAEIINGVIDGDGCPDEGLFELVEDRIILEETVLFDVERSRVKHAGRAVLASIVELWRQHPEWDAMVVEGHADRRGPEDYNLELSQRRADRIVHALVGLGFPADRVRAVGYGESRLRDHGSSERAHQRNRRVEFVIIDEHSDPSPTATDETGGTP